MKKQLFLSTMLFSFVFLSFSCKKDSIAQKEKVEPCQILKLGDVEYSLSPCVINTTMIQGEGDKEFTILLVPSKPTVNYGFSVRGYGEGFPTYGIMTIGSSSGGASGTVTLKIRINAKALSQRTYDGYLPIHVFLGSETGFDQNYLNLKVNVTVKNK